MWSRAPAEESERAVIDGDAACTHGSPTSARAYVGSWSHCPPFQDPPSDGIHFSWPRTSLNPSVPACWIAVTSRYILPSFSCGTPRRRAPLRGQSLPFAARAPVNGFGLRGGAVSDDGVASMACEGVSVAPCLVGRHAVEQASMAYE